MLITDELLKMAHINGLYGSQRMHQLNGDDKKVVEIQRQIEKETDEWRKMREVYEIKKGGNEMKIEQAIGIIGRVFVTDLAGTFTLEHKKGIVDLLKKGEENEKYKKMWEEFENIRGLWTAILPTSRNQVNIQNEMNDIKQKYFPEPVKKTITIKIEAKNEKQFNDRVCGLSKYLSFCNDNKTGDEDYEMKLV